MELMCNQDNRRLFLVECKWRSLTASVWTRGKFTPICVSKRVAFVDHTGIGFRRISVREDLPPTLNL